jgi:hypothetical protein
MIRTFTLAILATAATASAAQAHSPKPKPHPPKPAPAAQSHQCKPKWIGFSAVGTLVSHAVTQTAGADTPKRGDDRYSGTLTVLVTRANHRVPQGSQTYTLDNDRVHLDGTPKAGDRVKLYGKLTRPSGKKCVNAFAQTIDVRRVRLKAAKPA